MPLSRSHRAGVPWTWPHPAPERHSFYPPGSPIGPHSLLSMSDNRYYVSQNTLFCTTWYAICALWCMFETSSANYYAPSHIMWHLDPASRPSPAPIRSCTITNITGQKGPLITRSRLLASIPTIPIEIVMLITCG